jgi:hypothetical protein
VDAPRITTTIKSKAGPITYRSAAATSMAAKLKPASRLTSPAHLKSAHKAERAFKNFSLSKFAQDEIPGNYIDTRKVNDPEAAQPKTVQEVQKRLINQQLRKLPDKDTRNRGVKITFPVGKLEQIREAMPGMGERGGEVKLDDLLTYLRGGMNGTSFYSRGNPVMRRLTAELQARSQARAIMERVKKRSSTAQSGATESAAASKNSPRVHVPGSRKEERSKS